MLDIILATVAAQFIGFLWYNPNTFGNMWLQLTYPPYRKHEFGKYPNSVCYGSAFASALSVALLLSYVLPYLGATTLGASVQSALLLSALTTAVELPHLTFGAQEIGMFAIDKGHNTAVMVVQAIVLFLV
ncbi:PREDICTED: uncharacterized protein LOC109472001 isoform X2 [Branchiostoma belcheri]|uniref:Uncharacterized protein LOC109472001 isoform X2 n=1 Tax=Branchiostoma belcheri TaxID=7741 RepID=A0A6P4YD89_BRABE|nr:PREDICTED: uncharacterized protein LOC109472001 isoform X2 [Branchiostoma belcheri]